MKTIKLTILFVMIGLSGIVLVSHASAATEFISIIDPDNGNGTDYTSLATWEQAVQSDLTSASTSVFFWSTASGTIPDLASVTGLASGATATATHMTAATSTTASQQIILTNIQGSFLSGEQVYITSLGASSTYVILADAGDSVIAVATCRTTAGSADTTEVAVNGWTTSATNYIKIWTDPDEPFRHRGVWDEGAYRLETGDGMAFSIEIDEDYATIEGLQILKINASHSTYGTIGISGDLAGETEISNNILRANNQSIYSISGIRESQTSTSTSQIMKIYNNLIYDFIDTDNNGGYGIYINNLGISTGVAYIYNNTIFNCNKGYEKNGLAVILKNNLVKNSNDGFNSATGSFHASSTHNITDLNPEDGAFGASADSGTTNSSSTNKLIESGQNFLTTVKANMIVKNTTDTSYSYVTSIDSDTELTLADNIMDDGENYTIYTNMYGSVVFENEDYDDFHLDSSDTVAREKGADLSADSYLPVIDDIDGNSRTDTLPGRLYDIGADEGIAKIYRSVGPSATDALVTGTQNYQTNHLSIEAVYATFELPLPDNIGVGDAIQYDDDNDGDIDSSDSIVFIDKRLSPQKYRVKTANGSAPAETIAPDIDWSIFRAYTALANAEAGTENTGIDDDLEAFELFSGGRDIATNQEQWNIACYANGTTADATSTEINGWTTATSSYIKIYTPTDPREVGVSQRHSGAWDEDKYRIERTASGDYLRNLYIRDDFVRIEGLQVYVINNDYNYSSGIRSQNLNPGSKIYISDNIVKGTLNTNDDDSSFGIHADDTDAIFYICNNIVYGFDLTKTTRSGGFLLYGKSYLYNNTAFKNAHGIRTVNGIFVLKNNLSSDNLVEDFEYAYVDSASKNNASQDATAPGSSSRTSQTFSFLSTATGTEDLHLAPGDTGAKNYGVDLYATDFVYRQLMREQEPHPGMLGGTDIDSQGYSEDSYLTRPYNTAWDIGADEVITPIYRNDCRRRYNRRIPPPRRCL